MMMTASWDENNHREAANISFPRPLSHECGPLTYVMLEPHHHHLSEHARTRSISDSIEKKPDSLLIFLLVNNFLNITFAFHTSSCLRFPVPSFNWAIRSWPLL
jgi:hypothetical protein